MSQSIFCIIAMQPDFLTVPFNSRQMRERGKLHDKFFRLCRGLETLFRNLHSYLHILSVLGGPSLCAGPSHLCSYCKCNKAHVTPGQCALICALSTASVVLGATWGASSDSFYRELARRFDCSQHITGRHVSVAVPAVHHSLVSRSP